MDLTPGQMIYYAGIVGMVAVTIIAVIVVVAMAKSRKRLYRKLHEEYGLNLK